MGEATMPSEMWTTAAQDQIAEAEAQPDDGFDADFGDFEEAVAPIPVVAERPAQQ